MSERNFSAESLNKGFNGKHTQSMLQRLHAAETQAICLVKLFEEKRYLTIEDLLGKLQNQQIPEVELVFVVCFLAGYLSAETFHSRFDLKVFGEYSSSIDAKEQTTKASLVALLTMIDQEAILHLPDRVSRRKRTKRAANSMPARKSVAKNK